jgi:hypothetical protein
VAKLWREINTLKPDVILVQGCRSSTAGRHEPELPLTIARSPHGDFACR